MLTLVYCECCRKRMSEHADVAFEVFEAISEYYHLSGSAIEFSTEIQQDCYGVLPVIKWLESKQIVVTTESAQSLIKVKPLGFEYYTEDENLICHFCLHEGKYA